ANELVNQPRDPEQWPRDLTDVRAFLARDVDNICGIFHAKEAQTAKAMDLGEIWEPSPFPIELPVADRASRSDDPLFVPTPWRARPPWLLQDMPSRPGEIRFAKDRIGGNRQLLLVPISREQAEQRHRDVEPYVVAARLPDGILAILIRDGQDRNDPRDTGRTPSRISYRLELRGGSNYAKAEFYEDLQAGGAIRLFSVEVFKSGAKWSNWLSYILDRDGQILIHDSRTGPEKVLTRWPLTDAEEKLVTGPTIQFGEVEWPVGCVFAWLGHAGFGDFA